MSQNKLVRAYLSGICAWALLFLVSVKIGAASDLDPDIIAQLRLPRAILASGVGMGLAVAGATLQALFFNPLCEPYTLGISSGSTLGAILAAVAGFDLLIMGLSGGAILGALVFAGLLYLISLKPGAGGFTLLLSGVMFQFFGASLVALIMAFADPKGIQGALFWLLGDVSRARIPSSIAAFWVIAGLSFMVWSRWRDLDALLMGEETALALGVDVGRIRRRMVILTSMLVGICVSSTGMIGFVGLIVPHFCRRWVGSLHLRLIPLCAIWGAAALVGADSLSRVLARPYELPVGVMTALAGAPIFLWILIQRGEA